MKLRCQSRCSPVATLLAVLTAGGLVQAKATFIINNIDPAGVGFNDTTPVTPVGGNTGTTLGQQRLIVFQAAADNWGRVLESAIPIVVDASFAPLDCTNNTAIAGLGWANPVANVAGLPPNTQYPLALANRLLGVDLSPGTASIQAQFNSDLKACLGMDWYYGLDSKTSRTQADLFNTVKHELTHGLGFLSGITDETVGAFWNGYPTIYSA